MLRLFLILIFTLNLNAGVVGKAAKKAAVAGAGAIALKKGVPALKKKITTKVKNSKTVKNLEEKVGEKLGNAKEKIFTKQDYFNKAKELGYTSKISTQKVPFNSHGQSVYSNGKNYITPDIDSHNVTNGWKMIDKKFRRIGTYTSDLKRELRTKNV